MIHAAILAATLIVPVQALGTDRVWSQMVDSCFNNPAHWTNLEWIEVDQNWLRSCGIKDKFTGQNYILKTTHAVIDGPVISRMICEIQPNGFGVCVSYESGATACYSTSGGKLFKTACR